MRRKTTHASLCSGIGGFDLAAQWTGWKNLFTVEIDGVCRSILKKNFPKTKHYEDIKKFKPSPWKKKVDVLTAGFPCQPFSLSGLRQGKKDDRYLWQEIMRVVRAIQPTVFVGENVPGIINLGLDKVLSDLEATGYTTETFNIPACSIGGQHQRQRIWIVAYSSSFGGKQLLKDLQSKTSTIKRTLRPGVQSPATSSKKTVSCSLKKRAGLLRPLRQPALIRRNDGVSKRLDKARNHALGNAIVPSVAYLFFQAIDVLLKQTKSY